MSELFTLYKLIILYMLNKVDFPLTNFQISGFILDKGYTTYFKLQQALSELLASEFIREEVSHNRTFYHLTEDGAQTISFFKHKISSAIQEDINSFLKEKRYDLKNEISVKVDYYKNTNREYSVHCQIIEQAFPLIELTLTAPTESEAAIIANNWYKKNEQIYASIMEHLL